jgi:MarR family transcriptional regulator, organic hydroperoxide resistance regulator
VSEAGTTGSLVWRLSMKWRAAVDRVVAPFGLTHAQYVLLATLYGLSLSHKAPSQRELADATGLEPAYVSRLARSLEANQLIERTEAPTDVRAVELKLTSRGEEVVTQAIAAVRELHDELLEPIGGPNSAENRRFRDTLCSLLRNPFEGEPKA